MIVPHRHDRAAKGRASRHVGVPHHVARAIDAGSLAIPKSEDAVVLPVTTQTRLLRAPKRCRRQILVHTGLEHDVVLDQKSGRAGHLLIHRAKGRAAIACHVSGRVQPLGIVPRLLHQHQADQRLRPVQKHVALCQIEPVLQTHVMAHR